MGAGGRRGEQEMGPAGWTAAGAGREAAFFPGPLVPSPRGGAARAGRHDMVAPLPRAASTGGRFRPITRAWDCAGGEFRRARPRAPRAGRACPPQPARMDGRGAAAPRPGRRPHGHVRVGPADEPGDDVGGARGDPRAGAGRVRRQPRDDGGARAPGRPRRVPRRLRPGDRRGREVRDGIPDRASERRGALANGRRDDPARRRRHPVAHRRRGPGRDRPARRRGHARRGAGPVPAHGRAAPARHVRREPRRRERALHQPADRGAGRLHRRGVGRGPALLRQGAPSRRPRPRPRPVRPHPHDRRHVRRRVPAHRQGRPDRLGQ